MDVEEAARAVSGEQATDGKRARLKASVSSVQNHMQGTVNEGNINGSYTPGYFQSLKEVTRRKSAQ